MRPVTTVAGRISFLRCCTNYEIGHWVTVTESDYVRYYSA